jgi:hypothetical protein
MVYPVVSCSSILFCTDFICIYFILQSNRAEHQDFRHLQFRSENKAVGTWSTIGNRNGYTDVSRACVQTIVNKQQLSSLFLWWRLHYKQFIPRHVGKLNSFISWQQKKQPSHSSAEQNTCPFCFHCPWLFEREFARSMARKIRNSCVAPSFWTFFFGAIWNTRLEPKSEYGISKHGSL